MRKILKKIDSSIYFFLIVFLLSFVALFNTRTVPVLRFLDEFVIVALVGIASVKIILKEYTLTTQDVVIFVLFVITFLIGSISNLLYKYQNLKVVLEDIMRCSRWTLAYFGAKITFNNFDIKKYSSEVSMGCFFIASIIVLLYLLSFVFPLFEGGYIRYGIPSKPLFFEHVTFMSTGMICLILLLLNFDYKKINIISYVLLTFIIFTGARVKQIAVVGIIWIFYLISMRFKKQVKWWVYGLAGLICVFFFLVRSGFDIAGFLYTIRGKLYLQGWNIAINHFPFGSGYGTFGTETSANYFSPIYQMYGLDGIPKEFITDTGWAQIMAQFGLFGTMLMLINVVLFYYKTIIYEKTKIKDKYLLRMMLLFLVLSSFASSLLMGTETLICAVTFAVLENNTNYI